MEVYKLTNAYIQYANKNWLYTASREYTQNATSAHGQKHDVTSILSCSARCFTSDLVA